MPVVRKTWQPEPVLEPGFGGAPADHAVGIHPVHRCRRERAGLARSGAEEGALTSLRSPAASRYSSRYTSICGAPASRGACRPVRWHTGSLLGVGAFAPVVIALGTGGVTAAWFAAGLLSRVTDHRLERAIAVLLVAIGLLLIGERFLPAGLPALVPAVSGAQIVAGIALGLCIGTASTFLGVAGGEVVGLICTTIRLATRRRA
jgi:hypothetical protein